MANTELSRSKSICILAVVVCCFAILWPKIFLPMLQSALSLSGAQNENQRSDGIMLPPKVRQAMKMSRPDELRRIPGQPLQREVNTNEIPRTGGLMGLVMPLYTIGIVVFFFYTILRMVFKNDKEEEETDLSEEETTKPVITDFKMDPEYRKYILDDEYDGDGNRVKYYKNSRRKTNPKKSIPKSGEVLQNYGNDKVTKALHILIRDMEEYKTKLLEVEKTKRLIREVGSQDSKRNKSSNVCENETQEENEKQNHLEEEKVDISMEDNERDEEKEENEENSEQMKCESSNESLNESNDENEGNDETDYQNPREEYELKEKLIQNLETYYWESLLKGMQDLKHKKEE